MDNIIDQTLSELERTGRYLELKRFKQHGSCTVYDHSVNVARTSLAIAERLRLKLDRGALVRGALLHDYFLYDWHTPDPTRPKHAFYHPRAAWENARRDYAPGRIEEDIIRRHMFPVVPVPPGTAEGWIVCVADTYCALKETMLRRKQHAKAGRDHMAGPDGHSNRNERHDGIRRLLCL